MGKEALIAGAVAGTAGIVGMIWGMSANSKAKKEITKYEDALKKVEDNRQDITNIYEGVSDLSGMIKNEYADLSVATQAAEFQAEEADIALANTLDTLRETGASAGGATALAQEALRSKKDISASIEKQEVANEKLRADGKMKMNQAKMDEAQRMQDTNVATKQDMWDKENTRETEQLDRLQSQIDNSQQLQSQAAGAIVDSFGQIATGAGQIAMNI